MENEFAYSASDTYLVIPKRHVTRFFDLMPDKVTAWVGLINDKKKIINEEFNPDGYRIALT